MFQKGHKIKSPGRSLELAFPREGTPRQRLEWFRDQFLRLAARTADVEKKESLLKRAYNATVKLDGKLEVPGAVADEREQYKAWAEKKDEVDGAE